MKFLNLWQQHTDEMMFLESSVFTVCGKECTMEFQPSADMSWQSWACNELNQAATFPSPYANVSKNDMCTMGKSIGSDDKQWKPFTNAIREDHAEKLRVFLASLPSDISEKGKHDRKLAFMAENGMRQLGKPRIGNFAERVRPDPLHYEINAWQNMLDVIYIECVQRNLFNDFIEVLSGAVGSQSLGCEVQDCNGKVNEIYGTVELECSNMSSEVSAENLQEGDRVGLDDSIESFNDSSDALNASKDVADTGSQGTVEISPGMQRQFSRLGIEKIANDNLVTALKKSPTISSASKPGCGLVYLSRKIVDHYNDENKRHNKLPIRLIGEQAISLARYGYRLVDCLQTSDETEGQKVRRITLSKAVQYLRNAAGLFNKITITFTELEELEEFCQLYFNLLALFFPSSVNVTVWTVGIAIPYHARKLY